MKMVSLMYIFLSSHPHYDYGIQHPLQTKSSTTTTRSNANHSILFLSFIFNKNISHCIATIILCVYCVLNEKPSTYLMMRKTLPDYFGYIVKVHGIYTQHNEKASFVQQDTENTHNKQMKRKENKTELRFSSDSRLFSVKPRPKKKKRKKNDESTNSIQFKLKSHHIIFNHFECTLVDYLKPT